MLWRQTYSDGVCLKSGAREIAILGRLQMPRGGVDVGGRGLTRRPTSVGELSVAPRTSAHPSANDERDRACHRTPGNRSPLILQGCLHGRHTEL